MATHISSTPYPKARTPLWRAGDVWRRLTRPATSIREPERRRRARLLSALLVFLIPLGLAISILPAQIAIGPAYNYLEDPIFYASMAGSVGLIVAYILSRTERYVWGAALTLTVIPVMAIATVIVDPSTFQLVLAYLAMVILLASLLLSVQGTIIAALAIIASIPLATVFIPDLGPTSEPVVAALFFNIIMAALMVVGAAVRHQDLRQIERQAQDLAEAVRRAEVANKLKDQFLANMSHELRTPLNAIIGFTEVMLMGLSGELAPQTERAVSRIHHNSERLLQLIDDILDISKIEAGRVELVKEPFEPVELLHNIELTVRAQAEARGLEFLTSLHPGLPPRLVGDTKRLEQILINLTSNAIKFTEQGSVTVLFEPLGSAQWAIVVKDTGIGIAPHAQEYIFEKFRQIDGTSRRAYGGSGLGLAIVKELALLMDGNANVQSKPGLGSTFVVTLPLVTPEDGKVRS